MKDGRNARVELAISCGAGSTWTNTDWRGRHRGTTGILVHAAGAAISPFLVKHKQVMEGRTVAVTALSVTFWCDVIQSSPA
jgi:hypothetical protein